MKWDTWESFMTNEEMILQLLSGLKSDMSDLKQNVAGLKQDVAEIRLDIENRINPQLAALAEGQKTILETLAPKSRVETLEDEVSMMKTVIRVLSQDIAELKKAQ